MIFRADAGKACSGAPQFHQGHQGQGDDGDQDNHGKHFVKGVGLFHPGHVNTQAAEAAQPLADDGTHHGVGCGDPQSGKEVGQGGGALEIPENLPASGAHGPQQAHGVGVHGRKPSSRPTVTGKKVTRMMRMTLGVIS